MIGKTIDRYKIVDKLGEGGMGEVWLAEDTTLGRKAALKFLPSGIDPSDEEQARFLREAQAASALDHPNICTIYEAGDTDDGRIFIAMAFCDDETVKEKISRGPLELDEAIDIAIQIGEGLTRAHKEGIVHRDIKPANTILTKDGIVKIVDFGLAKLSGATQLTRTGSSMGTAAYMSPEQVRGDDVDHRTDIWSLGVMLFEMVAGQLPFQGDNETAMMYSVLNKDPENLVAIQEDIPRNLEEVISKALVKDLTNRYQNAHEMVEDLRKLSANETGQQKWEKSIVVLPFEDMSPDKDNEYFSDGLTEEIITDLSKIQSLRVISRNSAMMMKGTSKSTKAIGRELNVQFVLEGSVRKAGNDLRITAQLIDAVSDAHVWAEKYSGTLDDVFDIQEKVSRKIVDEMKLKLTSDEHHRLAVRPIRDVQAYDAWLRARQSALSLTKEGVDRAFELINQALEIIGDNALLHATLAWLYALQYPDINPDEEGLERSAEHAARANALQPDLAWSQFAMGISFQRRGDVAGFAHYCRRALELERDSHTLAVLGWYLAQAGKTEQARRYADEAVALDPLTWLSFGARAHVDVMDGRFDAAIERYRESMETLASDEPFPTFCLAFALACDGRDEEATALLAAIAKRGGSIWSRFSGILRCALQDDHPGFNRMLDASDLRERGDKDGYWANILASCFARVGEFPDALHYLERSIENGFTNHRFLGELSPFYAPLHGDARFTALIERARRKEQALEV